MSQFKEYKNLNLIDVAENVAEFGNKIKLSIRVLRFVRET
jgi:hypothetical protein